MNVINLDMEEEETRIEIAEYNRMVEDRREMEFMMRLKKEAKESFLNATTKHLVAFVRVSPNAKYHQWIKDLHPGSAHNGVLLEGMGKTIHHCFFAEESNHMRIWNDNLFTLLDLDHSTGRNFLPVWARQMDKNSNSVVTVDILSGSMVGRDQISAIPPRSKVWKLNGKSLDLRLDTIRLNCDGTLELISSPGVAICQIFWQ